MLTLQDILESKDQRCNHRNLFHHKYPNSCIISITLTIPGPIKDSDLLREFFQSAMTHLQKQFPQHTASTYYYEKTGPHGLMAIPLNALEVKKQTVYLEEKYTYSRLWDIDVYDINKQQISSEKRKNGRCCLLCQRQAVVCMREHRHTMKDILCKVDDLLLQFQADSYKNLSPVAKLIAQHATRAALYEAASFPSPGLVDPIHTGSHHDMDFHTFINSSCSLYDWFGCFVEAGLQYRGTLKDFFKLLKIVGINAEHSMYTATNQINTHKGLIFSMGLLLGSIGKILQENQSLSPCTIISMIKKISTGITAELKNNKVPLTSGEKFYKLYGITGIRGEAEKGFPAIFNYGLPALKKELESGEPINKALIQTLFTIICVTDDTTILCRQPNINILKKVKKQAKNILDNTTFEKENWQTPIQQLDKEWISLNLSPGGSADLLALTYLVYDLLYGQLHKLISISAH
jgi:holo-ACP synthase / triphosphoribosyl-dephospho-CoA synthase